MKEENKNQWLTEKSVARMLNISVSTLQKQRFKRCGLTYSKIGKSVRYRFEDVLVFMDKTRISFGMEQQYSALATDGEKNV